MVDGVMLKFLGELFYAIIALSAFYGLWDLFRTYKAMNSTVMKTHITAYELRKMIEGRARQM
jgi:hypothetical protein